MKWRFIAAKSEGTSHAITNEPCQDSFQAGIIDGLNPSDATFYCFVSDGAGSASQGKKGAEIACDSAVTFLMGLRPEVRRKLSEPVLFELFECLVEEIRKSAQSEGLLVKDYACTFIGVVVTETGSSFMQIGDGGLVVQPVSEGAKLSILFWPANGEYANTTNFLTDEDSIGHLMTKCTVEIPAEVGVFTDGLQRLCLQFETREVHVPFFRPMFTALRHCNDESELNSLTLKLKEFLNSDRINQRTDDDKTLILAVMIDD